MSDAILKAALALARHGLEVFPVRYADKKPAFAGWQEAATSEPERVRVMFGGARFNIGIATGKRSGVFVLDVDCKDGEDGYQTLADIEQADGKLPNTWVAESGGGGRHYYFRYPEGGIGKNRVRFAPGLDIRTDGGFIVAPPSVHQSGACYRWLPGQGPNDE